MAPREPLTQSSVRHRMSGFWRRARAKSEPARLTPPGSTSPVLDDHPVDESKSLKNSHYHVFGFWLAVLSFIAGIANTIASAVIFRTTGSPQMSPRTSAFVQWQLGLAPDTVQTFDMSLGAMGLGVGISLSAFRFFLFREPDLRRTDLVMLLLQVHVGLWLTLRACMQLPLSAGIYASVREVCSKGLLLALYVVAADPHNRPVFFLALFGIVIVLVALFDRAIQVGVYGAFQYGTWLYPVINTEAPGRYFAYSLLSTLLHCVQAYYCADQLGSDARSKLIMRIVALGFPVTSMSLQGVRVQLYPEESAPGNVVYVSEVYTAFVFVFLYTISPHMLIYGESPYMCGSGSTAHTLPPHTCPVARMRCLDTVNKLRNRVQELNRDAAIADAVSNAQKEFTRYIFHEVRSPLNNFSLGLEALADLPSVKESHDAREIVSVLSESSRIVRRITDDVLFIAQVDSDRFSLFFAPLVLREVVFATAQQHRRAADASGIRVAVDVDSSIPPLLLGDSNRMGQVLSNLLGNAIKYGHKGTGTIRIRARIATRHRRSIGDFAAVGQPSSAADIDATALDMAKGLAAGSFPSPRSPSASAHLLDAPAARPLAKPSLVSTLTGPIELAVPIATDATTHVSRFSSRGLERSQSAIARHVDGSWTMAPAPSRSGSAAPAEVILLSTAEGELVEAGNISPRQDPRLPFECPSGLLGVHGVEIPSEVVPDAVVVVARVEIEDDGIGLSAEQRLQIFKPYSQINVHREAGGTGLGLYISRRLAQQMGGRLDADSEGVGCGSTFWFEVPLRVLHRTGSTRSMPSGQSLSRLGAPGRTEASGASAAAGPAAAEAATDSTSIGGSALGESFEATTPSLVSPRREPVVPRQPMAAPLLGALYILVVDDVPSIRMLMRRILRQHVPAAVLSEAVDGEEACAAMAAAKHASSPLFSHGVVCMDKEMPRCDGFVATQRIRDMGFTGLILGVTGNAIAEDIAVFLDRGADAIVPKPVSVPALMGHIRAFAARIGGSATVGADSMVPGSVPAAAPPASTVS